MRVCLVLASSGNGGLEKHVRELSHQLVNMGHHVCVVAPASFLITLALGVEKRPFNMCRSRFNPFMLMSLLIQLRAAKADIIHAQANKAATMVGFLKTFLACPIVATIHNIKSNIQPFLKFNQVICVSKQLTLGFKNHPATVIYNGIEPPNLNKIDLRNTFSLPANYPVICAIGRLVDAKGFDLLLDAVNGLALSLIIVGDGPERKKLEAKIKILDPITCCKLLGYRSDAPDLMFSADALVIASRREGFSYVLNEALLCGTPVVSTDVPVANEVLPPALIVPTQNAQAIRSKLVYLLNNTSEWNLLMKPAQRFAAEQMTLNTMAVNTVTLYQQLLDHQRG